MIRPNQAIQPLEPPRSTQPRRRKLTRIAGVLAAAVIISSGGPAANAFWQTLGSNAGVSRADSIPAVAAPGATVSGGSASVTWKQGTTAEGRPVAGYTVARYSSASGGTWVAGTGGCAGTITALTCSEASLPAGTWYYTVTPVLGAWAGVESARSTGVIAAAADTTPPATPSITAPALITGAPATPNSANVTSVPITFSAEQGSSVRVTATDTPPSGGTAQSVFQVLTATGSNQTATFNLSALRDGTITYTAVATDAAGNISGAGIATSAKDATAPAVSAVSLGNGGSQFIADAGDKVVVTFSEPLLPSTICSGWTDPSGIKSVNGTLTIAGGNSLKFTSTDPGCPSIRFGTVTLNGNYSAGGDLSFNSSLAWNPGTLQLTVNLVSLASGTPTTKQGNVLPTYTPASGLSDGAGNLLPAGPVPGTNSRF
jgi:hypothetical protein